MDVAIALRALGRRLSPALAAALPQAPIRAVEANAADLDEDAAAGGDEHGRLACLARGGRLAVVSIHLPFGTGWDPSALDDRERRSAVARVAAQVLDYADLGSRFLTWHASAEPVPDHERGPRLAAMRQSLADLLPTLAHTGQTVAIELLPRSCIGRDEIELLALVEGFDPGAVGICLDVNHVMGRAAELPAIVARLAGRLVTAHLSDYDGIDERHWLPGAGVIDWPALLGAFRATGRPLTLIYETACRPGSDDPLALLQGIVDNAGRLGLIGPAGLTACAGGCPRA